jgi:serine protease Do
MSMQRLATLTILVVLCSWTPAAAQGVGQVFDSVNASVVVIKARGHDAADTGNDLVGFSETGSGVLISADGKVMTASHVVQAMDEINVEFLGGETVQARVVNSEPSADLSLLQLERVPPGVQAARLGNSDIVRVGNEVIVIGAPYGLSHSLTTGLISARWPANTVYSGARLAHRIGDIDRCRDEPGILEGIGDPLLFGDDLIADRLDAEAPTGKCDLDH